MHHTSLPLTDAPDTDNLPTSLDDVPNSVIGKFFQNNVAFDELTDFAVKLAESFKTLPDIFSSTAFSFDTVQFTSSEDPSSDHGDSSDNTNIFNSNPFPPKGSIQDYLRGYSLPDIVSFFSDHEYGIVMEKHELRKSHAGDVCLPLCNATDVKCNCVKLFGCVQDMTEVSNHCHVTHPYAFEMLANTSVDDLISPSILCSYLLV